MKLIKESLDAGGSIGSKKGYFYEKHFANVLVKLGYEILPFKDYSAYKDKANVVFHKYRTAPDQFTEIDFFIPTKNVGFWVTNLGQIERFKLKSSIKDFNEFSDLVGTCPHCKKSKLPNSHSDIIEKWTCKNCKGLVSPFDLLNKKSSNGVAIIEYHNKSASMQAHKQAYYRVGEYIESKTSDDKVSCIEIIYNKRAAWRNWGPVIELFFDDTIFIFDEFEDLFGSKNFQKNITYRVKSIIVNAPKPDNTIKNLLARAESIRESKLKAFPEWLEEIRSSRKLLWGEDKPISFPMRYSLYGLLKSKGIVGGPFNVYTYAVLIKIKSNKLLINSLSTKESNQIPNIIRSEFATKDLKTVTKKGLEFLEKCVNKYKIVIKEIETGKLSFYQNRDFWFPINKNIILDFLNDLLKASLKNNWYKFIMIADYNYKELNNTPFINEQFEPLETLTYLFLKKFKKNGIIKNVLGEPGIDHYEKTWLCDMPFAKNNTGFELGTDVEIELNNGKKVFIQCKSNTSFKSWEEISGLIKNSGITYKDSKRMIAHNFFSLFKMKNEKLIYDPNRIYIAIIDGNWCAKKKDIYRTIKLMYLLGVDEIFFADEFETRFKEYLIRKGA